jgi:hypothetical protein
MICRDCKHFIPPEPQYEPNSMGWCKLYQEWRDKFNGKPIPHKSDDRTQKILGNKIFFPLIERNCKKFESLI